MAQARKGGRPGARLHGYSGATTTTITTTTGAITTRRGRAAHRHRDGINQFIKLLYEYVCSRINKYGRITAENGQLQLRLRLYHPRYEYSVCWVRYPRA